VDDPSTRPTPVPATDAPADPRAPSVHHWRPAAPVDVPRLARLYRETAAAFGPLVYTPEQVAAWRGAPDDADRFAARILETDTELACEAAGAPLGYCGIGPLGYIHSLYVRADAGRRGIGATLLARALARAEARGVVAFYAWATPFSRPIFLRQGFRLAETVLAPFNGVMFERYRVVRP
jgi:GNAT superfamily N-acetyltransferase